MSNYTKTILESYNQKQTMERQNKIWGSFSSIIPISTIYHVRNKTDQNLTPYPHIHMILKPLNPPYIWKSSKLWHFLFSDP